MLKGIRKARSKNKAKTGCPITLNSKIRKSQKATVNMSIAFAKSPVSPTTKPLYLNYVLPHLCLTMIGTLKHDKTFTLTENSRREVWLKANNEPSRSF